TKRQRQFHIRRRSASSQERRLHSTPAIQAPRCRWRQSQNQISCRLFIADTPVLRRNLSMSFTRKGAANSDEGRPSERLRRQVFSPRKIGAQTAQSTGAPKPRTSTLH